MVRCRTGITITEAGSILASRGLALLREAGAIREEVANDPAGHGSQRVRFSPFPQLAKFNGDQQMIGRFIAASGLMAAVLATSSLAQDYPSRPVRIIVGHTGRGRVRHNGSRRRR
jgi:hypothetical protein